MGLGGRARDLALHHDDERRSLGGAAHVLRDLARGGGLLFHRRGRRRRILDDLAHPVGDPADRRHRLAGRVLHFQDLARDIFRRLGGGDRERFDFRGDDRGAAADLARARRLDGRVERQQVCLFGNAADELHHVADLLRG